MVNYFLTPEISLYPSHPFGGCKRLLFFRSLDWVPNSPVKWVGVVARENFVNRWYSIILVSLIVAYNTCCANRVLVLVSDTV